MAEDPGPEVTDDPGMVVFPVLVQDRAAQLGNKLAVVAPAADGSTVRLSYADVEHATRQMAQALVAAGVQPGDAVAIWAPNIVEWITAYYGIEMAGAALVPVNTRYKGREAAYLLRKSRATLLFTVTDFLDTDYVRMLVAATEDEPLPHLRQVVVLRGAPTHGATAFDQFLARADDVTDAAVDERVRSLGPDDLSDISFTSGTTGNPKGVVTTHAQVATPFRDWAQVVGLRSSDRVLAVAPFFHSFGSKASVFAALLAGATVYPQITFDVDACLDLIERERISVIPGPPAIFQSLLAAEERPTRDLSSLRLAVTGSANVPVELVVAMREVLGFDHVVTGYGLTESSGVATMCRHDDDPETIARTAGRALPGVDIRIVDDAGHEVPVGTPGEVQIRGYNVMSGYWEEPERTAETVVDGWLKTGDVGVVDERGYLRITDRLKDMYIVGGFNAYPAEIENALARHPAVRQAAVIGVPDDRLGEVGMAFVILEPGAQLAEPELIAWARDELANFKVPRYVEFVAALPVNASAKVLKPELRERSAALLQQRP